MCLFVEMKAFLRYLFSDEGDSGVVVSCDLLWVVCVLICDVSYISLAASSKSFLAISNLAKEFSWILAL